jgi:hypothetical protein
VGVRIRAVEALGVIAARARRIALTRIGGLFGLGAANFQMLESVRRPEWIYRSRRRLPRGEFQFRHARPVADEDVALCERLIGAYAAATGASRQSPGMWSEIFGTRQRELAAALERHDPETLARLLASMFRSDFVLGMAPGSMFRHTRSRVGARIWWLRSLDGLLSLGEALGAASAEGPEQGLPGKAFEEGIEKLVAEIESSLGISIDFPDVGAAYGLSAGDRLIPIESPEQIYAAMRLREAVRRYLEPDRMRNLRVVEVGAGYGGMAYWFLQLHAGIERYVIVDLPITNVLHGYFLSQALGAAHVSLFGEKPARVQVMPDSALDAIEGSQDVLVNKDSFPEMPERAMLDYLEWARSNCEGILYSYNQEAGAPFQGVPQNVVPSALQRVGGFERLQRDCSWLRRGYVEEVYLRKPA